MLYIFLIFVLATSIGQRKKEKVFRSDKIIAKELDPKIKTIYDQYIIHFDLDCLETMNNILNIDIIGKFLDEFKCYELNDEMVDEYPDIIDHWIQMDKIRDCPDEDEKELVLHDFCIRDIEQNEEYVLVSTINNNCTSRSVENALWNLDSACPTVINGTQYIKYNPSFDPDNFDIIVMDSGIDETHPEFDGIYIERIYDGYPNETALHSHGTHCSGTILGANYGVFDAKSAQTKLIDVRVFPISGSTPSTIILNGYDAIIDYLNESNSNSTTKKKAIINMSFGGGYSEEKHLRLASIRSLGGIIFAAAGNGNISASFRSPASSNDTITVGAHNQDNVRSIWPLATCCESNYGDLIDIWAPGTDIKSAVVGGGFDIWGGTSMATPFVAGVAANILANNPYLNFDGIKERLLHFAVYDIDDRRGNINLPRVQISCDEYCGDNKSLCGEFDKCENTYLSDITPISSTDYGNNEWYNHPTMLMGNSQLFDKFIVIHDHSSEYDNKAAYRIYELNSKYTRFTAIVGSARSNYNYNTNGCHNHEHLPGYAYGSFSISILIDGIERYYRNGYGQFGYDIIDIDITGANEIKIEIDNGINRDNICDHPVIAEPLLSCANVPECPVGYEQVGGLRADIFGCGLEGCDGRYQDNYPDLQSCSNACNIRSECLSFSFSPLNNDIFHPGKSVCSLYNIATSNHLRGDGQQILCYKQSPYQFLDNYKLLF